MKVAYNCCYGGFGLSPIALVEFAKLKGLTLTWYEQSGDYNNRKYQKVDFDTKQSSLFGPTASTKDLGDNPVEIPNEHYYYPDFYDENRADPDLIQVIEALGDKANGACSQLEIKEIPDGATFEITEYDGMESVEPPRMSW